jgi:predicted glycosyltransferase
VNVLEQPVSGPDLLFDSDIVIGAGGTMTREAAVLGTKTYTMFEGRRPAVDQLLIDAGRMEVLERPHDFIPPDTPRSSLKHWEPKMAALNGFVDRIVEGMQMSGAAQHSGGNLSRQREP